MKSLPERIMEYAEVASRGYGYDSRASAPENAVLGARTYRLRRRSPPSAHPSAAGSGRARMVTDGAA